MTLAACVSGSGRVTFSSYKSYVKAVAAAFVEIKTAKFTKKVSQSTVAFWIHNCHCDVNIHIMLNLGLCRYLSSD